MAAESERSSQASNGKEGLASRIRQTLHFTEISPRKYGTNINESIDLRFLNPRSQVSSIDEIFLKHSLFIEGVVGTNGRNDSIRRK